MTLMNQLFFLDEILADIHQFVVISGFRSSFKILQKIGMAFKQMRNYYFILSDKIN